MVAFVDSKELELRDDELLPTPCAPSTPRPFSILCPATLPLSTPLFIGTPGIIRSEFVFSRSCAVLAVGVSSIRPATDYWTKTRG